MGISITFSATNQKNISDLNKRNDRKVKSFHKKKLKG